jgi:hypothetical protein
MPCPKHDSLKQERNIALGDVNLFHPRTGLCMPIRTARLGRCGKLRSKGPSNFQLR